MNEAMLHDEILRLLPLAETADWDDVLQRAGGRNEAANGPSSSMRVRASGRDWVGGLRRRTLVTLVAALVVIAGAGGALAYRYLGPSPGFTAGFSAFDRLPSSQVPPSMPAVGIEHMAAYLGLTVGQAERRLRLLQSGLTLGSGRTQGQGKLYALVGENGTACMFLSGQGGTCLDAAHLADTNGVMAQVEPGYPGETPAVVALVADNVRTVSLEVNARGTTVPIVNNSVYADLDEVRPCDTIALGVTYDDGSSQLFPLHNPIGDVLSVTGPRTAKGSGPSCSPK